MPETTCQERLEARMKELFVLLFEFRERQDGFAGELWIEDELIELDWNIHDYGHTAGFEFVRPNTFKNQPDGFFRWSLEPPNKILNHSSKCEYMSPWDEYIEEFQLFVDDELRVFKVDYWSASYFSAERVSLDGDNARLILAIWKECFTGAVAPGLT